MGIQHPIGTSAYRGIAQEVDTLNHRIGILGVLLRQIRHRFGIFAVIVLF
jgi:hypothetical protein